jgi:hypothetical protein
VDNIFDVRRFDAVGDDADAAPRAREPLIDLEETPKK